MKVLKESMANKPKCPECGSEPRCEDAPRCKTCGGVDDTLDKLDMVQQGPAYWRVEAYRHGKLTHAHFESDASKVDNGGVNKTIGLEIRVIPLYSAPPKPEPTH